MENDVIEHRRRWSGDPDSWYASIPDYPRWIAVDSRFIDDSRRELLSPTYYTHYNGLDYACSQRVTYEGERHVHLPAFEVYVLERIPVDEPFPGWTWHSLIENPCPDGQLPAECLADVRRRLPAILEAAGTTWS